MQTQIDAPSHGVRIYSYRDMPSRKRNPREVLRATSIAQCGAVAASKHAAGGGGTPLTIFTSNPPIVYLDARLGVTGTTTCTALADQSTSANNFVLLTAGPTITATDSTLSNLQTLHFGNGLGLYKAALALSTSFHYLLVFKPITYNNGNEIIGDPANSFRGQLAFAGGSGNVSQCNGTFVNTTAYTANTWYLAETHFTNATGDSLKVGSAAATTGANAGANSPAGIAINTGGGTAAGTGVFDVFQFLIFQGAAPLSGELSSYRTYLTGLSASISL